MGDFYKIIGAVFISILALILFIPASSSHVPREVDGNNSLETAFVVDDPTKSWAIYTEIRGTGGANYYELELREGQTLRANLFVPEKGSFVPDLIVAGPGLTDTGVVPGGVDIPDNYAHVFLEGDLGVPEYEPFTPASYYYLADFEMEVAETGTYYVVVSEPEDGGRYGLAIGREERYGVLEWITVPLDVVNIREWEGMPLPYVFLPLIVAIIVGFSFLVWYGTYDSLRGQTVLVWLVLFSGLLYLGTGVMKFVEMGLASVKVGLNPLVLVTVLFASLPVVLGVFALRRGMGIEGKVGFKDRIGLAAYGFVGLFVWAGIIVGPVLMFLASVSPSGSRGSAGDREQVPRDEVGGN